MKMTVKICGDLFLEINKEQYRKQILGKHYEDYSETDNPVLNALYQLNPDWKKEVPLQEGFVDVIKLKKI